MSVLTAAEIAEMRADFVDEGRVAAWEYRQRSNDAWGSWTAIQLIVTNEDKSEQMIDGRMYVQRIVTAHAAEAVTLQLGDQLRDAAVTATVYILRDIAGLYLPRWTLVYEKSIGTLPGDDGFIAEGDA